MSVSCATGACVCGLHPNRTRGRTDYFSDRSHAYDVSWCTRRAFLTRLRGTTGNPTIHRRPERYREKLLSRRWGLYEKMLAIRTARIRVRVMGNPKSVEIEQLLDNSADHVLFPILKSLNALLRRLTSATSKERLSAVSGSSPSRTFEQIMDFECRKRGTTTRRSGVIGGVDPEFFDPIHQSCAAETHAHCSAVCTSYATFGFG